MSPLTALPGTELTDYVLQLLQKNGIYTVRDFMTCDIERMCKATNLTTNSFGKIKCELLKKHGPKQTRMARQYQELLRAPLINYKMGIPSLDDILEDDVFCGGCLLEICGFPAIGKTQLSLTISLNFATHYSEVLFIDTHANPMASRIYQMLKTRNVNKSEMGKIMQRIKIERTLSAQGVISILSKLLEMLVSKSPEVNQIKLVVIDSLPAVWFSVLCGGQKLNGKYLLTRLANLMRKISKQHLIVFVFVNLLVRAEQKLMEERDSAFEREESADEADSDDEDGASQISVPSTSFQIRPALGRYWLGVPTLRVAVEKSSENLPGEQSESTRLLRVLKSCYTPTGVTCLVRITNAGVA